MFDLNIYEAKVWAALLSRGISAAGELAEISDVPRSRTYDVLESLEKKGFIVMKLGKPIKYLAIEPSEVIKRVQKNIFEKAQEQVEELKKVSNTDVYQEIELLYKQGVEKVEPSEMSGFLKGRKNLNDHLKALVNKAGKSVIIATTEKGLERKSSFLRSALRRAKERGVKIKLVAPVNSKTDLPQGLTKVAEVRNLENVKSRFVVVDGKDVVFMTADDKEVHENYDHGIWVNSPFFASAFEQMFENTWQNLKPVK